MHFLEIDYFLKVEATSIYFNIEIYIEIYRNIYCCVEITHTLQIVSGQSFQDFI